MRLLSNILLLLLSAPLFSQTIYDEIDHTNFRDYETFHTIIETNKLNTELLNACIFFATNDIRVKKKLSVLEHHPLLEEAAMLHSNEMVELDFFDHTNRKIKAHSEPNDRAQSVGISTPYIAENIIEGFILEYEAGFEVVPYAPGVFINPTSRDTLQARTYLELTDSMLSLWMNSKGHRENILSKEALQLGCGGALYLMRDFNDMPVIRATQCFQWFQVIE